MTSGLFPKDPDAIVDPADTLGSVEIATIDDGLTLFR